MDQLEKKMNDDEPSNEAPTQPGPKDVVSTSVAGDQDALSVDACLVDRHDSREIKRKLRRVKSSSDVKPRDQVINRTRLGGNKSVRCRIKTSELQQGDKVEIYTRPDGRKVRRIRRRKQPAEESLGSLSVATNTPPKKGSSVVAELSVVDRVEIITRPDGRKVRRICYRKQPADESIKAGGVPPKTHNGDHSPTKEEPKDHSSDVADIEEQNIQDNLEALKKLRRHMPVDIQKMSEAQMRTEPTPNGRYLPRAIAVKFKRTNILQLIRRDPEDIVRWHPATLENFRVCGITLTEGRAVYEHLRPCALKWEAEKAANKMAARRWEWFEMFKDNFHFNLTSYQKHVAQHGLPGSHNCHLIGNQCPVRADKRINYDGDYGYTEMPIYCYEHSKPGSERAGLLAAIQSGGRGGRRTLLEAIAARGYGRGHGRGRGGGRGMLLEAITGRGPGRGGRGGGREGLLHRIQGRGRGPRQSQRDHLLEAIRSHRRTVLDFDPNKTLESHQQNEGVPLKSDPVYSKYFKMEQVGLPRDAVKNVLLRDGKDPTIIDLDPQKSLKAQIGGELEEKNSVIPKRKERNKIKRKKIYWNPIDPNKTKDEAKPEPVEEDWVLVLLP